MSYNLPLSIFLIKENYTDFNEIILDEEDDVSELNFKDNLNIDGVAFVGENKENEPNWNTLLKDIVIDYNTQVTKSTRAILLIRRQERIFAFSFGFGRHLIKEKTFVRNFGLRVILNNAKRNSIKSIDSKILDERPFHSRTQASSASNLEEFNLTDIRTMFEGITAESESKLKYGKTLSGKDALRINLKFTLNELPNLCDRLLEDFENESFKEYFPEMDRITEERDPEIVNNLNNILIQRFINKENIFLIIPSIIDWAETDGFSYTPKGEIHPSPSIEDFWENKSIKKEELTLDKLKSHYLYQWFENEVVHKWNIADCISADIAYDNKQYIYSIGEWFNVDKDLVSSVNNFIKEMPKCNIEFPVIDGLHEKHANILFENEIPNLFNMDRNNMTIDGDRYEVCDLLSKDKKLIHVKWWNSSANLSHLFSQGKVSGEILANDKEQRKQINKKINEQNKHFTNIIKINNYSTSDYTVVYAIIYKESEPFEKRLPFFSKVNLKQSVNELKYMGYNVEIAHIQSTCDRLTTEENNKLIKSMNLN